MATYALAFKLESSRDERSRVPHLLRGISAVGDSELDLLSTRSWAAHTLTTKDYGPMRGPPPLVSWSICIRGEDSTSAFRAGCSSCLSKLLHLKQHTCFFLPPPAQICTTWNVCHKHCLRVWRKLNLKMSILCLQGACFLSICSMYPLFNF